jgi:hypothetical protein
MSSPWLLAARRAIGTAFDVMVSGQTVIYDRDAQQPRNAVHLVRIVRSAWRSRKP